MTESKFPPITFEYIKSSDYKVHCVHGGIGGPNAHGEIVLNLYFERAPIPKKSIHDFDDSGRLINKPRKTDSKEGVIRDVLFGIALKPQNARFLADWLNKTANNLESIQEEQPESQANDDK